eukprot:6812817-Pyramimonas_sp.AAC.1
MVGLGVVMHAVTLVVDTGGDPRVFRLARLVHSALSIAAIVCATVKLCVVARSCCQSCLPEIQSASARLPQVAIGQP